MAIDSSIALQGRPAQFEYPDWTRQALALSQLKAAASQEQYRQIQAAQLAQKMGGYQRVRDLFAQMGQDQPRTLAAVGDVALPAGPASVPGAAPLPSGAPASQSNLRMLADPDSITQQPGFQRLADIYGQGAVAGGGNPRGYAEPGAAPNSASPTYTMDQMSPETQAAGRAAGYPVGGAPQAGQSMAQTPAPVPPQAMPQAPAPRQAPAQRQAATDQTQAYFTPEFYAKLYAADPISAAQIVPHLQAIATQDQLLKMGKLEMETKQLGLMNSKLELVTRATPTDQAGYDTLLQSIKAVGGDLTGVDPTFSAANVQKLQQMAIPVQERIKQEIIQRETAAKEMTAQAEMLKSRAEAAKVGIEQQKLPMEQQRVNIEEKKLPMEQQKVDISGYEARIRAAAEARESRKVEKVEGGDTIGTIPVYPQQGQGFTPATDASGRPLKSKEAMAPLREVYKDQLASFADKAQAASQVHKTLDEVDALLEQGVYGNSVNDRKIMAFYQAGTGYGNDEKARRTASLYQLGNRLKVDAAPKGSLGGKLTDTDLKVIAATLGDLDSPKDVQQMRQSIDQTRRLMDQRIQEGQEAIQTYKDTNTLPGFTPRGAKVTDLATVKATAAAYGKTLEQALADAKKDGWSVRGAP